MSCLGMAHSWWLHYLPQPQQQAHAPRFSKPPKGHSNKVASPCSSLRAQLNWKLRPRSWFLDEAEKFDSMMDKTWLISVVLLWVGGECKSALLAPKRCYIRFASMPNVKEDPREKEEIELHDEDRLSRKRHVDKKTNQREILGKKATKILVI